MDIMQIIIIGIVVLILGLVALIIFAIISSNKQKKAQAEKEKNEKNGKNEEVTEVNQLSRSDMKDIKTDFTENFLEFEEISDNMIVQNKGDKYIMVIKCQGINYDLMSEAEMISVEEGFIQFLNTLRFPIQLYIQTNSLDLTASLEEYNERIENTALQLDKLKMELKKLEEFDEDNFKAINELKYEVKKLQNVYEYGIDVVQSVEKISKSKSILQQTYYVVVPYFASELGANSFKPSEIKEMAFNELYTRCRGLISSLAVCSVSGKILDSFELAELLYVAYNRDEGEHYSFKNAIEAQYDRLYHTAPDVLSKKMARIDQEILETAAAKSNEEIIKASGRTPGDVYENNDMIQQLVYENTKKLIKDYGGLIDDTILQKATENVKEEYRQEKAKSKINNKKQEVIDDELDFDDEEDDDEIQIVKPTAKKTSKTTKTTATKKGGKK